MGMSVGIFPSRRRVRAPPHWSLYAVGMSLGALIRDLRMARNLSQADLAALLNRVSGRATRTKEDVSRWERGKIIPSPYWQEHLSRVLNVQRSVLAEQASLDRVNRRDFLSLTALTAVHGKLAADMVGAVAGGDPGPLTTVQTTHGTDLVIASLVDPPSTVRLRSWMWDGGDAVLRVNAAGVLAKLPGLDTAHEIGKVLNGDHECRQLYLTAVLARTCGIDWGTAGRLATDPLSMPSKASFIASRLANEALNPRDAGARWVSATMLRELSPAL